MRKLKARDPYSPECGGFGEIPKPTVTVWMGEGSGVYWNAYFIMPFCPAHLRAGFLFSRVYVGGN
ncbi:Diaminohydroxyphosphoribosylaminopyrimidine deaminase [Heyndrickxia coagulans]|jgi:hypothetical protein|uniref:Diaminohydroxyphosphoribosylaminopyrimidine deaminase n=1 Tax=Heyndrickxia coagulans TaxID=1398 RepID=A0A150JW58_HEYCO|nr:Diaminohydroxyphosphoribosylaminopyrimidine deaminase [Heyndrickxia coagulans]KYC72992.1 Diaminohydroxyphosphoribosylaminopyrimidine deaminase [Heyndrickxia coagulans]